MTMPIVTATVDFSEVPFTPGFRPGIETSSHFVGVDDGWTNPVTHYLDSVPPLVARRLTAVEAGRVVAVLASIQEVEFNNTLDWGPVVAALACEWQCSRCCKRVPYFDGLTALDADGSPMADPRDVRGREYVCADCLT